MYFWRLYRKKKTVKKCIKFFANRTYFPIVQSFYEKQEPEYYFLPILSTFFKSKDSLGLICKLHRWPFVLLSRRGSDFLCFDYIFSNFCLNLILLSNGPIKKSLYFWRLYRKKKTVKKCIKFFANRTYFPIVQSFYEKQEPEYYFLPILSTFFKSKDSLGLICKLHRWPFCTSVPKSFWFSLFWLYFQ